MFVLIIPFVLCALLWSSVTT